MVGGASCDLDHPDMDLMLRRSLRITHGCILGNKIHQEKTPFFTVTIIITLLCAYHEQCSAPV